MPSVLIGAQVRQTGGFVAALGRAEAMGAQAVQLFAQNNRQWRPPDPGDPRLAAYREAAAASPVVVVTYCHAPYLINVISPDRPTADRSAESLVANLRAATALGAAGLVLHPGSHRGVDPATAPRRVAEAVRRALDAAGRRRPSCDLLLENTAGAGGTVGRSLEELAAVLAAAGGDERIGVCLDSQHLWAAGVDFGAPSKADHLARRVTRLLGRGRLRLLHLNDSKVGFGEGRDRHENLGRGCIGGRRLAALLGQPSLQGLAAVLEVPGLDGHGPGAADLAEARRLHAAGLAARRPSRPRRAAGS